MGKEDDAARGIFWRIEIEREPIRPALQVRDIPLDPQGIRE